MERMNSSSFVILIKGRPVLCRWRENTAVTGFKLYKGFAVIKSIFNKEKPRWAVNSTAPCESPHHF